MASPLVCGDTLETWKKTAWLGLALFLLGLTVGVVLGAQAASAKTNEIVRQIALGRLTFTSESQQQSYLQAQAANAFFTNFAPGLPLIFVGSVTLILAYMKAGRPFEGNHDDD